MELIERVSNLENQISNIYRIVDELNDESVHNAARNNILLEDRLKVQEEMFQSMINYTDVQSFSTLQKGKDVLDHDEIISAEENASSSAPRLPMRILFSIPWSSIKQLIDVSQNSSLPQAMNASVYIGYWEEAQLRVVVKVFNTGKENELESYESELNVFRQLAHPNIIGILGTAAGSNNKMDKDKRAIVYRYAERGSLQEHIGELEWEQVLSIFQEIAGGLNAVHGLGLVHRDVKPANILITQEYEAKLADFGSTKLDRTEYYSGTQGYVDKELLKGDTSVRSCHDMYSLGISMLQILCNWKFPITQSGPITTIHDWMLGETRKGRSIVSERLRMTGCTEVMEKKILEVTKSLLKEPSSSRPMAYEIGEVLEKLKNEYMEEEPQVCQKVEENQESKRSEKNKFKKFSFYKLSRKNPKKGRSPRTSA